MGLAEITLKTGSVHLNNGTQLYGMPYFLGPTHDVEMVVKFQMIAGFHPSRDYDTGWKVPTNEITVTSVRYDLYPRFDTE